MELIEYKFKDTKIDLKVDYINKEIYLSVKDMSILFNKDVSWINKCVKRLVDAKDNNTKNKNAPVMVNLAITMNNGKTYKTYIYNSEIIINVGLQFKSEIIMDLKKFMDGLFDERYCEDDIKLSLNNANNFDVVRFNDGEVSLDVSISPREETVWLTQEEIAMLFDKSISTINEHIKNILTLELDKDVCRKFGKTELSSIKTKPVYYYNLDLILAVGYRVNSKRGIAFRKWASKILKKYLINGYSINEKRLLEYDENIISLNNKINMLEKNNTILNEAVFGKNYELVTSGDIPKSIRIFDRITKLSKNNIKIIDNYIDVDVIRFLEQYSNNKFIIYTNSQKLKEINMKDNIIIKKSLKIHSRYIFVDDKYSYCYTCSLNSLDNNNYDVIFLDGVNPNDIIKNIF